MGNLKTDDERKLLSYLGNLDNDEGGYSYADLKAEPPEGMGVTNNTISKYKKKFSGTQLSDIDFDNVREKFKELEIPDEPEGVTSNSKKRTQEVEKETDESGNQQAQEVDNLRTEVQDERKVKAEDRSSSSESWDKSDPTRKSHIRYVKANTKISSNKQAQQTLINMREDGIQINTEKGEHRQESGQ